MPQETDHSLTAPETEGEDIFRRGSVSLLTQDAQALTLRVGTTPEQLVMLRADGTAECTCGGKGDHGCAHIVAAILRVTETGALRLLRQERELSLGQEMLLALSRAMPGGESVRVTAILRLFEDGRTGIGLQMGQERLYAVRSIPELLTCYARGLTLELSAKFTYRPMQMRFSKDDEALLAMLMSHIPLRGEEDADARDAIPGEDETQTRPTSEGRFTLLTGAFLQSVLRFFETRPFMLMADPLRQSQANIRTVELPLCFSVNLESGSVFVTADGAEGMRLITPDARYVFYDGRIVRLHSAQARVCRLLATMGRAFRFTVDETEETLSTLLPALSTVGTVVPSAGLSNRLLNEPLKAKVYVDLADNNVEARVELHYGQQVLYPFDTEPVAATAPASEADALEPVQKLLLRDGRAEAELLDFFSDAGFVVREGRIVLRRAKDILAFCTQGVAELGKLAEVYVSEAFRKIKPRRFVGKASFRMRGGRLVFTLLEDNEPVAELLPILQAVQARQQYVRLKNGEFLDVRDMTALAPVAQELLDAALLDDPQAGPDARELSFGAYRAAYMVSMLRLAGGPVEASEEVERASRALSERAEQAESFIPQKLNRKLAPYQRRGAGWILSLYEARMGGILADEMGLGKTVQVIAALSAAKKKNGSMKSLIVTPTSLVYHWLAEFKRFDDGLTVRLVTGIREERRQQIGELKNDPNVDVILTSYPLLRRDIENIRDIPLRFAILDEAQFVKNAQSIGAAAAKELNAQVRVALTGTPMENHTGELWSIFDFVLPGYLGTQAAFLRRYGGSERAEELQERIRPFLMRRLKQEVLKDLPGKHEQSLYAAMTPEQERVYRQLLETLRAHVGEALASGSLPRARMQVLSVLLKLRQVCCHPKLFLPDYEGTSGKLELLVQTVQQAIAGKRRILVFSQFVGMLQIIRKRLSREGVKTLYLDGSTQPELRQELCDRFNGGEGQVFLISLKAGGTGLNLTGADLVIHYDPWWNPAVEDQATDRAHRIGQTKDVDVLRLIAQGTIEEKVTDLSKRKRAVFDRVVLAGETALESLTEEDIRNLFF
ncbi:MAG TPA: DEAD/DEAH box helicase [Candidatus Limiplasma sp.]|nr:DEAD/DEAH box helicase [Candidatus Limiplasma sp.]HPS81959.1 DEAD/DEAH box helicase [Candidatus Limiplasma sp.]